jgi:hypothetical protein
VVCLKYVSFGLVEPSLWESVLYTAARGIPVADDTH